SVNDDNPHYLITSAITKPTAASARSTIAPTAMRFVSAPEVAGSSSISGLGICTSGGGAGFFSGGGAGFGAAFFSGGGAGFGAGATGFGAAAEAASGECGSIFPR